MEIYLYVAIWVFVGLYCIVDDWTNHLDVKSENIVPLIFFGATVGVFFGAFNLTRYLALSVVPKKYRRNTFISKKKEV